MMKNGDGHKSSRLTLRSLCLHAVISVVKMKILNLLVRISNIIEMVWL